MSTSVQDILNKWKEFMKTFRAQKKTRRKKSHRRKRIKKRKRR